jgi:hypothetical protein
MESIDILKRNFYEQLDERNKRLYAGLEATIIGYYGVKVVSNTLSINAHTVRRGQKELQVMPISAPTRIRKQGGGAKKK